MPIQNQFMHSTAVVEPLNQSSSAVSSLPSLGEIQVWLTAHLAKSLDLNAEDIDLDTDFIDYGMNSVEVVNVSGELESFLGCRLDPTLVLDYSNIRALSEHLVGEGATPALSPYPADPAVNTKQLLSQLDQMSDDEVDGLLTALLSE
ncbi:MAG: acyl carrier protein [Acaryochloridaceae cyanobacterium SU_2_1]|nr:acyl carrier protein [Acaryochloridaceae cyanobacterium SU_2_1]